jgi:hypothetical protein
VKRLKASMEKVIDALETGISIDAPSKVTSIRRPIIAFEDVPSPR